MNAKREIKNGTQVIGSIQNKENPDQVVDIRFIKEENAFVTAGIERYFGLREILIPVHLIAQDFSLIGAIISSILEKISQAQEQESSFKYIEQFEVLDAMYTLKEYKVFMKLEKE